ncbi:MAG TPA: histidine kinase dimerization/phospho-acceptor domain-containing protein [Xanthomonadales bacterium]|nr:histidine kinase dimerization/phospho-acceptor domain-containing protein [Xanthomonadales bacterium]
MSATLPPPDNLPPREVIDTLGRFAAAMAHEINNPLGALVMNAEVATLLIDRGRTDELPAVLRQIQSDARRCAQKVRNMADVASPVRVATARVPLGEALESVRRRMCRRLNRSVDAVLLDVPAPAPKVVGNREAIEYALYQLTRQVFASGVEQLRLAVDVRDGRVCASIGAADLPACAFPGEIHLGPPPRYAHDEAALDVTRCLLAGSQAELFVTSHAGKLAYHVMFEKAPD